MKVEFELGADSIYRCRELNGFEFSTHGFGSRLASPPADVTLRQTHSSQIWNAAGLLDREYEGDALVSTVPGLTIGIRTADCVPILLLDLQTHAVAAVHAGWRGTAARILAATVSRLGEEFGCRPQTLYAAIGPCIRPCCYQVGEEVARQFVSYFPEWGNEPGRRTLDLAEVNTLQLRQVGLDQSQIFDSNLCTSCSTELLFSYRREPKNPGRLMASISRLS